MSTHGANAVEEDGDFSGAAVQGRRRDHSGATSPAMPDAGNEPELRASPSEADQGWNSATAEAATPNLNGSEHIRESVKRRRMDRHREVEIRRRQELSDALQQLASVCSPALNKATRLSVLQSAVTTITEQAKEIRRLEADLALARRVISMMQNDSKEESDADSHVVGAGAGDTSHDPHASDIPYRRVKSRVHAAAPLADVSPALSLTQPTSVSSEIATAGLIVQSSDLPLNASGDAQEFYTRTVPAGISGSAGPIASHFVPPPPLSIPHSLGLGLSLSNISTTMSSPAAMGLYNSFSGNLYPPSMPPYQTLQQMEHMQRQIQQLQQLRHLQGMLGLGAFAGGLPPLQAPPVDQFPQQSHEEASRNRGGDTRNGQRQ